MIPFTNIGLYDTPGLIPEGRASDLLCDSCAQKIIQLEKFQEKHLKLSMIE